MSKSTTGPRKALEDAIDVVEGGYEFLLAYAAQGRKSDRGGTQAEGPRERLAAMAAAIARVAGLAREVAAGANPATPDDCAAFFDAVERDAAVAAAAIRVVLAQPDIGSQLVDNLNASIHLRALLTDLFLLDESFKVSDTGN